jgi:hypothetical protein
MALMDLLIGLVRARLGLDSGFTMAQLIQGGTWRAGRKIAESLRHPRDHHQLRWRPTGLCSERMRTGRTPPIARSCAIRMLEVTYESASKRLQEVLEAIKAWPIERQDMAAEILEHMNALATSPYKLSREERIDLEEALAEARRGEFASDAEVTAMFARHGL